MKNRPPFSFVRALLCLLIGVLILWVDYASKAYVHSHVPYYGAGTSHFPYGGVAVFQGLFGGIDFSINLVLNKGAAWGMLSQYQDLLLYFRIVLILGLIIYVAFFNRVSARAYFLTLVIAGALGNVIDYFKYGVVIDFFHFKFWGYSYPLFNVADMAISIGIILLLLHTLFLPEKKKGIKSCKSRKS